MIRRWWQRWRMQRGCLHHTVPGGESWIQSQLVDLGRRKMRWCTHCGRTWIT